jgi:hypothetical protein
MTRSEIIQTAINQYEGQVEFLSEDANLMVGTGFETNFRCQAEHSKTILEILTAELEREKNPPLTWEELMEMDGKPVFIVSGRVNDELNGWFLVSASRHNIESVEFTGALDNLVLSSITDELSPEECFYGMMCNSKCEDKKCRKHGLHQLGWLAYRYEPKGDPNV